MPIENIIYNDSYYRKIDINNYRNAMTNTVQDLTEHAESQCHLLAPVKTGKLRASHSCRFTDNTGQVVNNCGYASYVAFGTSRNRAQNYPLQITEDIKSQNLIQSMFESYLIQSGILE